jgi:glycosyltransferase involved in cell wall biosynthesis
MRRIAIITESSVWGGLEAHTVGLAETLSDAGFEPSIVCVGDETFSLYQQVAGSSVHLVKVVPPRNAARYNPFAWRRAFRDVSADAAILQKGTLNTGTVALDLAIRTTFGPYVAIEQLEPPLMPKRSSRRYVGGIVPGLGLWWYRWKLRGYLRSLGPAMTICVSDSVRDRLASMYGFPRSRLTTVRHGVDVNRFRPDTARRQTALEAWGIPPQPAPFVFGSMRRLVAEKGLDVAIEAFAKTVAACSSRSLYLVIVGDGPERSALERLAVQLGVGDRVRFPGFSNVPWELYPAFDVFLLPSRIEALGVVALEAMACDCEVIGSNVGGIPEMISDPSLGTLVPAGNAVEWATAMTRAVQRPTAERTALLARAREHVRQNFDRRSQYLQIASLLAAASGHGPLEIPQCA